MKEETAIILGENIKYSYARLDFLKEDSDGSGLIRIRTKTDSGLIRIKKDGKIDVIDMPDMLPAQSKGRVRNPEATCRTCPYFWMSGNGQWQECRRHCPTNSEVNYPQVSDVNWCGEHPDFWKEE